MTLKNVFSNIYAGGGWGRSADPEMKFYSGGGSHEEAVVMPYVEAVCNLLKSFKTPPKVVDLGCGDFNVGSKICHHTQMTIACDIVPDLISFNKEKFRDLNVYFQLIDLTMDELPYGEIVIIRQVLQHLSNASILNSLPKIINNFKYLVITEHLPAGDAFIRNLDKPDGANIRNDIQSGVVLTDPPFNLKIVSERVLCSVPQYKGVIKTILYEI
jgi:hypothetical protein